MIRYLKSYPLFRESILALVEFNVANAGELVDAAKKVLKKI